MGHLLGYARVSTTDQQPDLQVDQVDALTAAGCYRVFTETASGWAGRSGTSSTLSAAWPTAASGSAASRRRSTPPPRDRYASQAGHGRGDRQDPRRQPRLDLPQPGRTQELGLGGGSDAEVGLWPRLVIAAVVLDQPIVLGCRVIEHPEGIARRAHPRLRFTPPAQLPVPLGRLLHGSWTRRYMTLQPFAERVKELWT
jgi:hypothetical protein